MRAHNSRGGISAARLSWRNGLLSSVIIAAGTMIASATATALELERRFEISETDLTNQVNALRALYKVIWIDIRSEPKVFNGRTYSGFISIHAKTDEDRDGDGTLEEHYCRWDTAFNEDLASVGMLYFEPIPTAPVYSDCYVSNWNVIDKAIGDWVTTRVQPHFANFDGLPDTGNINAKGYYFPDRLVLSMRLKSIKVIIPEEPKLPLDQLQKLPKP